MVFVVLLIIGIILIVFGLKDKEHEAAICGVILALPALVCLLLVLADDGRRD